MVKREGIYITNLSIEFIKDEIHPIDGTKSDKLKLAIGGNKTFVLEADEEILQTISCIIQER